MIKWFVCLSVFLFYLVSAIANTAVLNRSDQQLMADLKEQVSKAEDAAVQGQWRKARDYWKAALQASLSIEVGATYQVILHYGYGRTLGVLCDWDKAEKQLQKALELDRKNNGPFYLSLIELSRFYQEQNKFEQAKQYYDELLPALNERKAAVNDPFNTAELLDGYADTLEALGAKQLSKPYRDSAFKLRKNAAKKPSSLPKTPYGAACR